MSLQAAVVSCSVDRNGKKQRIIELYLMVPLGEMPIINSRICSLILNLKIKCQAFLVEKTICLVRNLPTCKISKLLKGTGISG